MTLIYLLRHAESLANEKGILAGRSDVGLSERGKSQSKSLAKTLKDLEIDRIVISPIKRCSETISPFVSSRKNTSYEVMEDFQEMDYGNWSGKRLKFLSLKRDWRKVQNTPEEFTFPNGESFLDAWGRVSRGMKSLSTRYPKSKILVVTHGDIIKMAIAHTLGADLKSFQKIRVEPASLSGIEYGKTRSLLFSNKSLISIETKAKVSRTHRNKSFVLGGERNS
ncbi:MAG: histidine phosphatase family protein [Actinomycetales bacterium]|nr:histidine phosphatase family protein [Actinomycetales bacterium]